MKYIRSALKSLFLVAFLSNLFLVPVFAQLQGTDQFSGSDASSYQCFDAQGILTTITPVADPITGYFYCDDNGNGVFDRAEARAVYIPPKFQQFEIWFSRVLYAVWALVGSFSFLMLVYLGYQWILTRGDVTKITEIRKRIINYIIGFAMVFLAHPILSTTFRLMGINKEVDCYNVNMPGFQFFFVNLCTAPTLALNACTVIIGTEGIVCSPEGLTAWCTDPTAGPAYGRFYECVDNLWVFQGYR